MDLFLVGVAPVAIVLAYVTLLIWVTRLHGPHRPAITGCAAIVAEILLASTLYGFGRGAAVRPFLLASLSGLVAVIALGQGIAAIQICSGSHDRCSRVCGIILNFLAYPASIIAVRVVTTMLDITLLS